MKRIAIINENYLRDAQVFTASSALYEDDPWSDENYRDFYSNHFIGIFEGTDEDGICIKAAESMDIHPDAISLIEFDRELTCTNCRQRPMRPKTDNLDEQDMILCPVCGYGLLGADEDYFGLPKFCSDCGQKLEWTNIPEKDGV